MADILGTAVSGLQAFQRALDTTSHNISNVNTEGYSRQQVDFSTRTPEAHSNGFIGTGVETTSIRRVYDNYLTGALRSSTTSSSLATTYYDLASQIDDLLADPEAGLTPSLNSFFASVQDVSSDPSSAEARQVMLSEGEALADRFHYLDGGLQDLEARTNEELRRSVGEVNQLASTIAELNKDIVQAQGRTGQPPNDLLDQRDLQIQKLAEYVDVKTVAQADGSLNVFIGSGQSLVMGGTSAELSVAEGNYEGSGQLEIYYGRDGAATALVTDNLRSGAIGGILKFRDEVLQPAQNALGQVAIGLAGAFNDQHTQGLDLDGALGADFFSIGQPDVYAASGNAGVGVADLGVSVSDASSLTTSDYTLRYDGAAWVLADGNGTTIPMSGSGTAADPYIADGLSITIGGVPQSGDRFQIQPTRHAAQDIAVALSDARDIAAAAPIKAESATDSSGVPTNLGSGSLENISLDSTVGLPLNGDIALTYDDTQPNNFTISDTLPGAWGATLVGYDPVTRAGSIAVSDGTDTMTIAFEFSGDALNGDAFTIGDNRDSVGDNSNALALASLETRTFLNGGTASFGDAYGQLVADVGTKTAHAETNMYAQEQRLRQATDDKEAVSGVNLDEEAAKLLEYQQAYQAVAKVITTADELFQTLLNAV